MLSVARKYVAAAIAMGADVIKVEPPRHGEESRQLANYREGN